MGCNYIAAKKLVLNAPETLVVGRAADVLGQKHVLEDAGVMIAITPEFPYNEDGQLLNGAVIG